MQKCHHDSRDYYTLVGEQVWNLTKLRHHLAIYPVEARPLFLGELSAITRATLVAPPTASGLSSSKVPVPPLGVETPEGIHVLEGYEQLSGWTSPDLPRPVVVVPWEQAQAFFVRAVSGAILVMAGRIDILNSLAKDQETV